MSVGFLPALGAVAGGPCQSSKLKLLRTRRGNHTKQPMVWQFPTHVLDDVPTLAMSTSDLQSSVFVELCSYFNNATSRQPMWSQFPIHLGYKMDLWHYHDLFSARIPDWAIQSSSPFPGRDVMSHDRISCLRLGLGCSRQGGLYGWLFNDGRHAIDMIPGRQNSYCYGQSARLLLRKAEQVALGSAVSGNLFPTNTLCSW